MVKIHLTKSAFMFVVPTKEVLYRGCFPLPGLCNGNGSLFHEPHAKRTAVFSHQSNCAMTTAAAPRGHSPWRESATTGCNSSSEKGCMPVTANANVVFYYVHLPQEFEKIANFPRFNAGHHLKALAYKCPRNRCQHLKFRADVAKIHQSCPVADKYVVSVEKMVPFTYIPYHSASITTGVVSGY